MKSMFLVSKGKSKVAHLWDDSKKDTICRMASSGGLKLARYQVTQDRGKRKICQNCLFPKSHFMRLSERRERREKSNPNSIDREYQDIVRG